MAFLHTHSCHCVRFDLIVVLCITTNELLFHEGELCRPPCENGGRCLANEKGDWRCYCWPDFSGERCEVNHCTDYCLNGGTCMGSPLGKSVALLKAIIVAFSHSFFKLPSLLLGSNLLNYICQCKFYL